jgi:hypothetical protein
VQGLVVLMAAAASLRYPLGERPPSPLVPAGPPLPLEPLLVLRLFRSGLVLVQQRVVLTVLQVALQVSTSLSLLRLQVRW